MFSILNKDKENDQIKWANRNRDYFKGNISGKDEFAIKYREIFSGLYKLDDLKDYIKDMLKNEAFYNNDCYLRNIEVILKNHVSFDEKYNYYGEALAKKLQDICNQ